MVFYVKCWPHGIHTFLEWESRYIMLQLHIIAWAMRRNIDRDVDGGGYVLKETCHSPDNHYRKGFEFLMPC